MSIDLETPRFKNADLLRLVPGLTTGTLQNWVARKIFEREPGDDGQEIGPEKPKKYKKAHWNGCSVIAMRLMLDLAKFQIGPAQSVVIAEEIIQELDWFLENIKPDEQVAGVAEYKLELARMQDYRVGHVRVAMDGGYSVSVHPRNYTWSPIAASLDSVVSIQIEVDMLFMQTLNALIWADAGLNPLNGEA